MALFVDDISRLSEEYQEIEKGQLPPLLSFVINCAIIVFSIGIAVFFVFPFLRTVFQMSVLFAGLLTLGTMILLMVLIGEFVAGYVTNKS